jgi:hypothetical protein
MKYMVVFTIVVIPQQWETLVNMSKEQALYCNRIGFKNIFAMPNKHTFTIKPIHQLISDEDAWSFIDPFPFTEKIERDALDYLISIPSESVDGVLFDPPYSPRQLKEAYDNVGQSWDGTNSLWSQWETEIARVIKPGGKCIKCGWNSHLISDGFEITRILLVNHGSHHNDTIVTVQKKIQSSLTFGNERQ